MIKNFKILKKINEKIRKYFLVFFELNFIN